MRYIEPHAHMVSRVTDDYVHMATAGCQAICEPAFWAGFDRSSADGFRDYFLQLTEHEPKRAAKFGLPHFSWLCINPKESEDTRLAREVLALIPGFLDRPNVLGIGGSAWPVDPCPQSAPGGQAQGHASDPGCHSKRQPHRTGASHHRPRGRA